MPQVASIREPALRADARPLAVVAPA